MGPYPEQPWNFPDDKDEFSKLNYVARVNKPFACPAYIEAYGDRGVCVYTGTSFGSKKLVYRAGAKVSIMETKYADGYLSALVKPGNHWINLWTIFNRKNNTSGPMESATAKSFGRTRTASREAQDEGGEDNQTDTMS